jgi:hypothetical protein
MYNNFFSPENGAAYNVEKYDGTREATDDNVTQGMRFARWITKATATHTL